MTVFSPVVPTEALANKLFGAPEPSAIARSLPTAVPDSPSYRTPRTPRTPRLRDPTQTPRFYPVVKEGRPLDAKVCIRSYSLETVRCCQLLENKSSHRESRF